jgi:hypothetical protein
MRSSETSVITRATRRNVSEGGILHSHCRENRKSYELIYHVTFLGKDVMDPLLVISMIISVSLVLLLEPGSLWNALNSILIISNMILSTPPPSHSRSFERGNPYFYVILLFE